jgi:hypothetical protein
MSETNTSRHACVFETGKIPFFCLLVFFFSFVDFTGYISVYPRKSNVCFTGTNDLKRILQHVDPLLSNDYKQRTMLGNDRGISNYTAAVTE